jgi:hypothetical protein
LFPQQKYWLVHMFKKATSKIRRVISEHCDTEREQVAIALLKRDGYTVSLVKETSHPLSWVTHLHPFYKSYHKSKSWSYYVIPQGTTSFYKVHKPGSDTMHLTIPEVIELASRLKNNYPLKPNLRVPAVVTSYEAHYALLNDDYWAIPLVDKPVIIQVVYDRYFKFMSPKAPRYKIVANYNVGSDTRFTTSRKLGSTGIGRLLSRDGALQPFLRSLGKSTTAFVINLITYPNVINENQFILHDVLFLNNEDFSLESYELRYNKVKEIGDKYSVPYARPTSNKFEAISKFPIVLFKNKADKYLQNNKSDLVFHSLRKYYFVVGNDPEVIGNKVDRLELLCFDSTTADFVPVFTFIDVSVKRLQGSVCRGSVVKMLGSGHVFYPEKMGIYSLAVEPNRDSKWIEIHTNIKQILER